jgi:hypothetical protein
MGESIMTESSPKVALGALWHEKKQRKSRLAPHPLPLWEPLFHPLFSRNSLRMNSLRNPPVD